MKRKNIFIVILLLIISNLATFIGTSQVVLKGSAGKVAKIEFLEKYVKDHYLKEIDEDKFFTGQLKGIVESLGDPYSQYLTKEDYDSMMEVTTGKFFGIGIIVSPGDDNLITIVSPIKGSPAERAGLLPGDKIIKINDKEYLGKDLEEAVKNMKGEKGTVVKLSILTKEGESTQLKEVEITRDEIKVGTVVSKNLDGIGYIGISQFDEETGNDFKSELENLKKENIKGLILDLRGNPGGIVDTASTVADTLLPEGEIVYAKDKGGNIVFNFKSDSEFLDMPLTVLINKGSASASEIVSGAIKDFNRGTLIGETTFGKGIVQSVVKFPSGDGIKLTTSEYFTPKGVNIHGVGINPDIEVELPKDIKTIGVENLKEDLQLQKAIEVINEKANK